MVVGGLCGSQPFVREFTGFRLNPPEIFRKSGEHLVFFLFLFKVFQLQHLRKYPRRPSRSFWYHLELQRPTFDRFHIFARFVFVFVELQNMTIQHVPFIFKRTGRETMLRL